MDVSKNGVYPPSTAHFTGKMMILDLEVPPKGEATHPLSGAWQSAIYLRNASAKSFSKSEAVGVSLKVHTVVEPLGKPLQRHKSTDPLASQTGGEGCKRGLENGKQTGNHSKVQ